VVVVAVAVAGDTAVPVAMVFLLLQQKDRRDVIESAMLWLPAMWVNSTVVSSKLGNSAVGIRILLKFGSRGRIVREFSLQYGYGTWDVAETKNVSTT
jgi:hypothetical protein